MFILTSKILDDADIYLSGDFHFGSALSSENDVFKMIDEVASNRKAYLITMGDLIEAIAVDDKRYHHETNKQPIPLKQAKSVVKALKPVKDKILCMLTGNHEMKIHRIGDFTKDVICENLGIVDRYGGYTTKLSLVSKKEKNLICKFFLTHGRKTINSSADDPIRRESNMKLQLKRHLENKAGDCLLMAKAHTHKLLSCEPSQLLYLTDSRKKIRQNYTRAGTGGSDYIPQYLRYYVNTGSFYKTYTENLTGYAEMFEYDPVELGYIVAEIRDRKLVNVRRVVV